MQCPMQINPNLVCKSFVHKFAYMCVCMYLFLSPELRLGRRYVILCRVCHCIFWLYFVRALFCVRSLCTNFAVYVSAFMLCVTPKIL